MLIQVGRIWRLLQTKNVWCNKLTTKRVINLFEGYSTSRLWYFSLLLTTWTLSCNNSYANLGERESMPLDQSIIPSLYYSYNFGPLYKYWGDQGQSWQTPTCWPSLSFLGLLHLWEIKIHTFYEHLYIHPLSFSQDFFVPTSDLPHYQPLTIELSHFPLPRSSCATLFWINSISTQSWCLKYTTETSVHWEDFSSLSLGATA